MFNTTRRLSSLTNWGVSSKKLGDFRGFNGFAGRGRWGVDSGGQFSLASVVWAGCDWWGHLFRGRIGIPGRLQ